MRNNNDLEHFSNLLEEFRRLPGVSFKNANRLVFNLLSRDVAEVSRVSNLLLIAREKIKSCLVCCAMTEWDKCKYCIDERRNKEQICVVATQSELLAIREVATDYKGLFHVLGGLISPLEGISTDDLSIKELLFRLNDGMVKEIIFAFSPTPEGEVTISYIQSLVLKIKGLVLFKIASGVAVGANLEFADRSTLLQAFAEKRLIEGC